MESVNWCACLPYRYRPHLRMEEVRDAKADHGHLDLGAEEHVTGIHELQLSVLIANFLICKCVIGEPPATPVQEAPLHDPCTVCLGKSSPLAAPKPEHGGARPT